MCLYFENDQTLPRVHGKRITTANTNASIKQTKKYIKVKKNHPKKKKKKKTSNDLNRIGNERTATRSKHTAMNCEQHTVLRNNNR